MQFDNQNAHYVLSRIPAMNQKMEQKEMSRTLLTKVDPAGRSSNFLMDDLGSFLELRS